MNWKRVAMSFLFSLPVIGLLAFGLTRDPRTIDSPLPGRPAPDFTLPIFENGEGTVSLSELRGQVVVLNFFASWCLECRYEHAALAMASSMYRPQGVQFFAVLYNDTPEKGRRWIEQMGGQPYPALYDEGSRTAIDYGLYGVPETFIIDRNGLVVQKKIGPWSFDELTAAIDKALAIEAVDAPTDGPEAVKPTAAAVQGGAE
ncbi:MAG: redoxin domain-containing protein [Candidatus Cloacimonetes bacterium]|jgi:cytochrome c biogenesis protein CcmG/thiol:disulfide interchange protein DsbE|nr:redoxin domain-containing protein [Candidatus Cloacimonadota bacterium]